MNKYVLAISAGIFLIIIGYILSAFAHNSAWQPLPNSPKELPTGLSDTKYIFYIKGKNLVNSSGQSVLGKETLWMTNFDG